MTTQTDNGSLDLKLDLRRYFLARYHAETKMHARSDETKMPAGAARAVEAEPGAEVAGLAVLDCCQGSGVIWGRLKREFRCGRYWGFDLKEKAGRVRADSALALATPGLASSYDVVDVDTYGHPWKHWSALLPNLTRPTTVFLTWGQQSFRGPDLESLQVLGLTFPGGLPRSMGLGKSFLELAIRARVFQQPASHGHRVVEAREAISPRSGGTRYIGVRLEPGKSS